MQLGIEMNGLKEYQQRIKAAPDKANYASQNAMKVFTVKVKTDIQKSLNEREKIGNNYIPSEPGKPPHKRTGHLYQSVYNQLNNIGRLIIQGIIGDNAEYAAFLEYGTSKMPPRPYFRPAIENNKSLFEKSFKAIFDKL